MVLCIKTAVVCDVTKDLWIMCCCHLQDKDGNAARKNGAYVIQRMEGWHLTIRGWMVARGSEGG